MFFNPFDIKSDENDNIFVQGLKFQIRESQTIKEKIKLEQDKLENHKILLQQILEKIKNLG